ncbi:TetR/AcrR family transcriptional regulator [Corynebacterium sp. MNWGS58]|uniref:TetR/AcrR family transcriptional regulator n=1 Tax=Corynebacterium sp. 102791.4 TaxID=3104612 RepID=UPI003514BD12
MPVMSENELNRRRQEILVGARKCFAEYGYEGATVRRLEQATGKSRGAIFHHFSDKENLFLALAREDAARQAEVVAREGLVEVMRDIVRHPEKYDWLATRLEISKMLRTDASFRARWQEHQAVLDQAVHDRLAKNAAEGRMRVDVPIDTLQYFLEMVMDGLITRNAMGMATDESVLDIAEQAIRRDGNDATADNNDSATD